MTDFKRIRIIECALLAVLFVAGVSLAKCVDDGPLVVKSVRQAKPVRA